MRIRSVSVLALSGIMLLAACGGDDSESSANTTTTLSNTHLDVETPDGQVSLALNGKLPPGWPSDFPIPKGASPAGSGSLVNGEERREDRRLHDVARRRRMRSTSTRATTR